MADKAISKHLSNLERQFAGSDPILQKAGKIFQELDQLEFDLGLLEAEETTARQSSWWPIICTLGGYSPAKSEFIDRYLGGHLQVSRLKFSVLQYSPQASNVTLPGTALDADHRLPFYRIGREIDHAAPGESAKINAYLESVTVNNAKLRNRLIIDTPALTPGVENPVNALLRKRAIAMADLVLVFNDLFEAEPELIRETVAGIVEYQDSNKFVFVIDHSEINLDAAKSNEIAASWQRRLTDFGIHSGQFVVLSQTGDTKLIDQRIANLGNDRSYRILAGLEQSIRNIE